MTATSTTTRPRGYIAEYRPQQKTRLLLDDVMAVLDEYREHWPITARQIYYRLIAFHGYEKTEAFYERLCGHLANARRGRLICFSAIRDDGVTTVGFEHYEGADHFLRHLRHKAKNYRRNLLASQGVHVEVWCEAAGMIIQLANVAHTFSIPVYSSSGFDSLTAKKMLADRICEIGKPAIILHLGDYDPSGVSMFDAVAEDVAKFVLEDRPHGLVNVEFRRVALTREQVERLNLPTAPAKSTDSRSKAWRGETCQLEALAPDQIAEMLTEAIEAIVDLDQVAADVEEQDEERRELTALLLTGPSSTAGRKNGDDA